MRPLATCCGASYGSRPPRKGGEIRVQMIATRSRSQTVIVYGSGRNVNIHPTQADRTVVVVVRGKGGGGREAARRSGGGLLIGYPSGKLNAYRSQCKVKGVLSCTSEASVLLITSPP